MEFVLFVSDGLEVYAVVVVVVFVGALFGFSCEDVPDVFAV